MHAKLAAPATYSDVPGEIMCLAAMYLDTPKLMHPLLAHKALADSDTMFLHKALKQPDKQKFMDSISKEISDKMQNGNFIIKKHSNLSEED